jgi:hypothetical protein
LLGLSVQGELSLDKNMGAWHIQVSLFFNELGEEWVAVASARIGLVDQGYKRKELF